MEAIHVKNADWLMVNLGEHIDRFAHEMAIPGINGPSLYAHFARVVQFGKDHEEFWVVVDGKRPVGFANWNTLGLPHIGKVYAGFLHCWDKNGHATRMLHDQYIAFGERHNATWYVYEASSRAHVRLLERELRKRGYDLHETGFVNCISRNARDARGPT